MKKRIIALLATAIMVVSSTVMTFAEVDSTGLIGQFKFDGDLKNEVTGEEGVPTAQGLNATVGAATEHTFNYVDGVDGSAIYLNEEGATVGVNLGIAPKDGKAYTVSVWAKALGCNFANPLVWIGKSSQAPECWVGIWPQLYGDYAKGPCLGSNGDGAAAGSVVRVDVYPTAEDGTTKYGAGLADAPTTFDWMNITITVDNGVGCLYYNGNLVGMTMETEVLPDVIADGDDTVKIYLGANGWDAPFNGYVDSLYVYDRVLTGDEVKTLVADTNVNGVTLTEYYEIEGPAEPIETTSNNPTIANKDNASYLQPDTSAAAADDAGDDNNMGTIIAIVAVIVVVIVVVVVVAVVASKKKSGDDDDEE